MSEFKDAPRAKPTASPVKKKEYGSEHSLIVTVSYQGDTKYFDLKDFDTEADWRNAINCHAYNCNIEQLKGRNIFIDPKGEKNAE